MKYSFRNDYSVAAHPSVIEKLVSFAAEQNIGYGYDEHSNQARRLLLDKMQCNGDIYFLAGGTQTNMVVISHALKPYQAVIACDSGHINVHETGAVEGSGHKIITVAGKDGKILVSDIEAVMAKHTDIHKVEPKLVYISQTTEFGTVYSKAELKSLACTCKKYGLYLFLDGARLASALACSDATLADIAKYTDVFYIGGTKNGTLFGEAVVITNPELKKGFDYHIKNKGALLAKGFVCALGFEALFTNNLYEEIGQKENECALFLKEELLKLGFKLAYNSPSNQQFIIMDQALAKSLEDDYGFEVFEELNEKELIIRLVTAFDTKISDCQNFIRTIMQKI